MFRTPTSKPALRKYAAAISLAFCLPFLAKADLGITIVTTQAGNQVTADFLVYNFDDIATMQYTIQWDPLELQFVSVGDFSLPEMSDIANFGTTHVDNGQLTHAWWDPATLGISLPDCSSIFRVNFISLNGQVPPITIANSPTPIEVTNGDGDFLSLEQGPNCNSFGQFSGIIFHDTNENCINDTDELGLQDWQVKFQQNDNISYVPADPNGYYVFNGLAGSYEVTAISPENNFWLLCQPTFSIDLLENQQVAQDFAANPSVSPSSTANMAASGFLVKIAPNPVRSGQPISIETTSKASRSLTLQAFDVNGRLLRNWRQEVLPGTTNFNVQTDLEKGLYLLKITDENGEGRAVRLVVL